MLKIKTKKSISFSSISLRLSFAYWEKFAKNKYLIFWSYATESLARLIKTARTNFTCIFLIYIGLYMNGEKIIQHWWYRRQWWQQQHLCNTLEPSYGISLVQLCPISQTSPLHHSLQAFARKTLLLWLIPITNIINPNVKINIQKIQKHHSPLFSIKNYCPTFFFFIGKLHKHPKGFEPAISPSIHLIGEGSTIWS